MANQPNATGFPPNAQAVPTAQAVAPAAVPPEELQYAGYGYPNPLSIWREGKMLAFRKDFPIPAQRCIKCNEPTVGKPLKRRISWHHPAIYLTILAGLLIYVIVALIVRKNAIVYVGLCEKHRNRRRVIIAVSAVLMLALIPLFYFGATTQNSPAMILIGIASLLVGLIVYIAGAQVVSPRFIDDNVVKISGAGAPYLASFQLSAR